MADAFAILRTKKLKTPGNVAGSASHIERTRPTHNARPGVANEWLEGGPGMYASAKEIWDSVPRKRSDAVHAFEVLLTASPEAFANGLDLEQWKAQSMAWMRKHFKGATIVGACLHLDESTPHIQAIIVPTDRKPDGTLQLNCKKYLGSAAKLSAMQTDYAKAVKNLGLERGLQGSRAKHTQISQFYSEIRQAGRVKLVRPSVATPPLILSAKGRVAWAAEQSKAVQRVVAAPITALQNRAAAGLVHQRQNRELKSANAAISKDLAELRRKEQQQRLRELPLELVAQSLGCYQTPELLAKDRHQWESPVGKLNINGSKFFNVETGDGDGGALSLVMHVNGCNFQAALAYLRDEFDADRAVEAAVEQARIDAQRVVAKAPTAPFQAPEHLERAWPRVRDYLTRVRALAGSVVDKLRSAGWIGADHRNNAFFLKAEGQTVTSVELRGTGRSSFKGSRGRSSSGVFPVIIEGSTKLAVCESAIDAISYVQLHDGYSAIATCGTGKWACAKTFMDEHGHQFETILCASDNGQGGAGMAKALDLPHAPPPSGFGDWNEFAQAAAANPELLTLLSQRETSKTAAPDVQKPGRFSGLDYEP